MTQLEGEISSRLSEKYRLLFHIPPLSLVVSTLFISALALFLVFDIATSSALNGMKLGAFGGSIAISLLAEKMMMWRNHLATNTKLLFLTSISFSFWAILSWLGLFLSSVGLGKNLIASFFILGSIYAIAFKLLVYGTIYLRGPYKALPFTIVQPLLIFSLNPDGLVIITGQIPLLTLGVAFILSVATYVKYVDWASNKYEIKSPIKLLRGFIGSWTTNSPDFLEEILDEESSRREVKCQMVTFAGDHSKRTLMVPEVHPGPFEPIGSSNLPYQLYLWARENGLEPVVVHGVSGHHLNLASKKEVQIFLRSLDSPSTQSTTNMCSTPLRSSVGDATVTGIAFGKSVLIFLTLAPKGMEDVPESLRRDLERSSGRIGFTDVIIVDSHNGQGEVPSKEDCEQLSEAGNSVLGKLKDEKQYTFSIGYAHTTSAEESSLGNDVGPAGIGILTLDLQGLGYAIVVADANNMILGLRERIINELKSPRFELLEFCTSDTHSMAAKIMNSKGYYNLGEDTLPEVLIKTVKSLVRRTAQNSEPSRVNLLMSKSKVKIMGEELLNKLDYTINACILRAKKGGFILGILSAGLVLLSVI
ncbi:MAG: DUF2070 family protein [Nitrososphaerales archaeon]